MEAGERQCPVVVEIRSLSNAGLNKRQIAARLGIHRETVARYLKDGEGAPRRERMVGSRKADGFREHVEQRLAKYPELSAEQLYREVRKNGYVGSRRTLRRGGGEAPTPPSVVPTPVGLPAR